MVGIGHRAADQIPRLVPSVAAFVEQNAHQLRDGQGGVRVVDVHGRHIGQIVHGAVFFEMTADDVLDGGGDQEVLLRQPQRLALAVVVRRIQHLRDDLGHGLLLHRPHIFALVEQRHIHAGRGRAPQPQRGYPAAVLAGHHHIVGLRQHHRGIFMLHMVEPAVPAFADVAVKAHLLGQLRPRQQPALAARQPEIGHFGLPSVHQLLTENPVFVQQGIADGGNGCGGQSVQEAGGQPSESAVAEPGIRLQLIEIVKLDAVGGQHARGLLGQIHIFQCVLERTSHQELHAEVIHLLGLLLFGVTHVGHALLPHTGTQHQGQRLIKVFVGCLRGLYGKLMQ